MSNHGRTGSLRDQHPQPAAAIATLRPNAADVRIDRDRARSWKLPEEIPSDRRRSEDLTGSLPTPPPVAPKPANLVWSPKASLSTPVAEGVNTASLSPSSKVSESKQDSPPVHVPRLLSPHPQAVTPEVREILSESPGPQKKTSSCVEVGAPPVRPPKTGGIFTTPPDNASCESESERIVSPPPVGPKPNARLQRTQPKLERTVSSPPKVDTCDEVSHDQATVTNKKRWSHHYQLPVADTLSGQAKHKLDKFFDKIKPSALKAKWLKGQLDEECLVLSGDEDGLDIFQEDYAPNFETTVKAIGNRLLEIRECISKTEGINLLALKEMLLQLEQRRILICIFGRHNSGKSTFMNVLLSNELLPMNAKNETSIKVCIEHNATVHLGPCLEVAAEQEGNACKNCPYLCMRVLGEDKPIKEVARGADSIKTALKQINAAIRKENIKAASEYQVHTFVPCFSEASAPPSWTVLLVDNPGFGEVSAHTEIMEQAEIGLATGSAFIFVMSYLLLDDAEDVAALRQIYEKDRRIFLENRLLIVVTFFDQYFEKYTDSSDDDDDDDDNDSPLSEEDVRQKVSNQVLQATDGDYSIPEENVIPVCGQWALYSRLFLHHRSNNEFQTIVKKCFLDYGKPPPSNPVEMAQKLEDVSGIKDMERRIAAMAHSSFETWVQSSREKFQGLLRQAHDKLLGIAQSLQEHAKAEEQGYSIHWDQHEELEEQLEQLKSLIGPNSAVREELTCAYRKDTEDPVTLAKKHVQEEVEKFKEECKEKCQRVYTSKQFQEDVDTLLTKVSDTLIEISERCRFSNLYATLEKHRESLGDMESNLIACASELLPDRKICTLKRRSGQQAATIEDIMSEIPTGLSDLNIPGPKLTNVYWRKLCNMMLKREFKAGYKPAELEKPIQRLKESMEEQCSVYFEKPETEQTIVELYFDRYHKGAESMLNGFLHRYGDRIEARRKEIIEEKCAIDSLKDEANILTEWSVHLDSSHMGRHLDKMADECLKQTSLQVAPKHEGTPPAGFTTRATVQEEDVGEATVVMTPGGGVAWIAGSKILSAIMVHVQGQQFQIEAEKGLSLEHLLGKALPGHGVTISDYNLYSEDGVVDGLTDSTLYAENHLYLQARDTTEGPEPVTNTNHQRTRSGALCLDIVSDTPPNDMPTPVELPTMQQQHVPSCKPGDSKTAPSLVRPNTTGDSESAPSLVCPNTPPLATRCSTSDSESGPSLVHPNTPPLATRYSTGNSESGPSLVRPNTPPLATQHSTNGISTQLELSAEVHSQPVKVPPEPLELARLHAPVTFEEDFKDDLIASCEAVKARLEQLHSQYPIFNLVSAELVHDWKLSEKRNIRIAVFGYYNSGKSSLINALIGHRLLPVSASLETVVPMKVKHLAALHDPNARSAHPVSETCDKCPRLMKESGTRLGLVEVCKGVHEISDTLQLSNRSVRSGAVQNVTAHVVCTNIPMLAFVPQTWQVYLEDNPGFKGLKQGVQKLQFKEEVMDLSAYIYTVSYDRVEDEISGEAFRLISEQDQAKTAFLQERLIVVVTSFDRYYKAVNEEEMLSEEQVKKVVCDSIKKATSRSFPKESVVPVCSQWSLIARQLAQHPDDHKLKQRALKCLEHHCESGQESEDALSIAKTLEVASGILNVEKRIVEVTRQACNDSNWGMTAGCLMYLEVALHKLTDHTHGTRELLDAHGQREEVSRGCLQRITESKESLAMELSPRQPLIFQELQSHCTKEATKLSIALKRKFQERLQTFQEECLAKVTGGEAFGRPQLEKDIEPILEDFSSELVTALINTPLQSHLDDLIKRVEEKHQGMREEAHMFCTYHAMDTQGLPSVKDTQEVNTMHLSILEDMPLLLCQKDIKKKSKITIRHPRFTGPDKVVKAFEKFNKVTEDKLMEYMEEFSQKLTELQHKHYIDHVRLRLSGFEEEFSARIKLRQEEIEMMLEVKEKYEGDTKALTLWREHLQRLKKHLEVKSKEALAKAQV